MSQVSEATVLRQNAYVLFYQRCDGVPFSHPMEPSAPQPPAADVAKAAKTAQAAKAAAAAAAAAADGPEDLGQVAEALPRKKAEGVAKDQGASAATTTTPATTATPSTTTAAPRGEEALDALAAVTWGKKAEAANGGTWAPTANAWGSMVPGQRPQQQIQSQVDGRSQASDAAAEGAMVCLPPRKR